jgi:hypothetical protein
MTTPALASSQQNATALPGRSGLSSLSDDGNLVTFTNRTSEDTGSDHHQIYLKNALRLLTRRGETS